MKHGRLPALLLVIASIGAGCSKKDEPERRATLPPALSGQPQAETPDEREMRKQREQQSDEDLIDDPFVDSVPPEAPAMPKDWAVVRDETFDQKGIAPVAERLKGDITALRNVTYDVGGKQVKLNIIVTRESWDTDTVVETLQTMKPAEFVIRNGNVVYEFVAKNEAIPEIRKVLAAMPRDE